MGMFDQLSKTIAQGVDRARFEAEKFQRTTKLQGEVNDLRRQVDEKLIELGQRAYDLQRTGQINLPSVAELSHSIDQLRGGLLSHEEELKRAQAEIFPEPTPFSPPPGQPVPVSYEAPSAPPSPATTVPSSSYASPAKKNCPSCSFEMPGTAMFCPNCGARVTG